MEGEGTARWRREPARRLRNLPESTPERSSAALDQSFLARLFGTTLTGNCVVVSFPPASVAMQVTSVVRVSGKSFQVKWIEQHFDHDAVSSTEHWTGILTVVVKPPTTAEALRKNPLGLYVNAIDWSRELSSQ